MGISQRILVRNLLLAFFFSLFAPCSVLAQRTEIRAVWVHPGTFGIEKDAATKSIQSTLDEYQSAGINTAIVMIKSTSGYLYYQSEIGVQDPAYNWDFFRVFLDEARQRGITIHPWFCVFTEGALVGQVRQHPEWLIRSKKSELVSIVNPALPQVRQYEISLMTELAKNYLVDWIHLDYIRFPCEPTEDYFSFDSQTRSLFKEYSGEDPSAIKAMDSGNIMWNEWIEWNAGQVTQFLRELRQSLASAGRSIKISAAVFPNAENARVLIGQDWQLWAHEGLVDMLCPMLYTNNMQFFEHYTRRAVEITKGHCRMCAGIGIGTSHNQNSPEGVVRQINLSRTAGADGVVFFSSSSLKADFLAALRSLR
ncbi:MAG: family 10 glycosylhydrolase [bacterium]